MQRRELLKYAGATALAAPFIRAAKADNKTVKVGIVGAKTGPLAPATASTFFPVWRLWANEINQAGGLKLKDGQRKVELIEYDDHTQPSEAIKAVEHSLGSTKQIGSWVCTALASTWRQRQHSRSLAIRNSQWPPSRTWARSSQRNIHGSFWPTGRLPNTAHQ